MISANNKGARRALALPSVLVVSAVSACGAHVEPGSIDDPSSVVQTSTATAAAATVPTIGAAQHHAVRELVVEPASRADCQACYRQFGEEVCSEDMARCVDDVVARGVQCHNPCLVC